MIINIRRSIIFLLFVLGVICLPRTFGQRFPQYLPSDGDSILTLKHGVGATYYMKGRKMNLPIMEWFMQDHPAAKKEISGAIVADQLSVVGYTVGSIFTITGLLVYEPNKHLGQDLMMMGGISLGVGILFQVVSGKYKKRAVERYNEGLRKSKSAVIKGMSFRLDFSGEGTQLVIGF